MCSSRTIQDERLSPCPVVSSPFPGRWAKMRLNLREPWVCWASPTQNQPFLLFLLWTCRAVEKAEVGTNPQPWGSLHSTLIHFPHSSIPAWRRIPWTEESGGLQRVTRVEHIDSIATSEPKWTGMGKLNSDDNYIYNCGQESHRGNGVALIIKESEMQYLHATLKITV